VAQTVGDLHWWNLLVSEFHLMLQNFLKAAALVSCLPLGNLDYLKRFSDIQCQTGKTIMTPTASVAKK
jgi:hypothetical protein